MKLLVVGCGAVGLQHVQNAVQIADTAVVDVVPERASKAAEGSGATNFYGDLDTALSWNPDGVVVSVPNEHHIQVASRALLAGADVLVEKPISFELAQVDTFLDMADTNGRRVFVVSNLRFHPAVQAIKSFLPDVGRPLFVRAHYGNYLPDMRPGIDYRDLYVSDPRYGGVILDSVHEIDYLQWLFGSVRSVVSDFDRLSDLEILSEDYSGMILRHDSGVRSEIHVDYLRRVKRRGCEISGTHGLVDWLSEGKSPEHCVVRLFTPAKGWVNLMEEHDLDFRQPLADVMRAFVKALNGVPTDLQTGYEAREVLHTALTVRNMPRGQEMSD